MIESVRASAQGLEYEIVAVDGQSRDGTPAWLFSQPDIVFASQPPLGAVAAYNLGFSLASSPLVCNLNDDCLVHGDLFNEAIAQMRDPQIAQVAFPFGKEELVKTVAYAHPGRNRNLLLYGNFALTRRSVGEQVGWWGDYLRVYGGDAELSMNIYRLGLGVVSLQGKGWVEHLEVQDDTRVENTDSEKFYAKWADWQE